jgi:Putative prokaryotic signal transducing protein
MSYCPTCKQEFPSDVRECPDDKAALVGELPFQTVSGDNATWVEIASTGSEDEAKLLAGFLENEGIPAQIENVKFSMEPINFGTMGDIRIYVGAQDEERAVALLHKREAAYEQLDDDGENVVTDEGTADIADDAETEVEKA